MLKTVISQLKCLSVSLSLVNTNFLGSRNYSSVKDRRFKENPLKNHKIVKKDDFKKKFSKKEFGMASKQSSYYDDLDGEEIDEEVDIYKYHHLKKLEDQGRERHRDLITMKIVEKKYFNKEQEKILSWSDKEHIRYLHNTDPQKWTYEVLADQFKVDERVIKTIAKAKWLPKKLKLPEEKLGGSKSGFLLKEPAEVSEKEVAGAQKKFSTNRKMSFKEFCVESGSSVATKPTPIKPLSAIENQDTMKPTQEDTLLKYLTGGAKSDKWANQNENLNLRLDEDRTGNTNVYYYDNQHGYQHPFGKGKGRNEEDGGKIPFVKEGELYRRGDAFYDENGDFLYRVPGLSGNKL